MKRRRPSPLPAFPAEELELVNRMDRSPEPLEVAAAALRHFALTRRPVPDYHGALAAADRADAVCAALWRRGML